MFAGSKIAREIPSLNEEIQEWVHCALQRNCGVGWGGPVCPIPQKHGQPRAHRVEQGRRESAEVPCIFLFF